MADFPIQVVVFPLIAIVVVLLMRARQKKMIADGDKTYANFRLADVAQRMRLSIEQGDPNFNLMMAYTHHSVKDFDPAGGLLGAVSGDGTKESRALLRGAPNGRPTELSYYHRTDLDVGAMTKTFRHTFECRLSMQVMRPFPPFEIVLRNPRMGMESPPVMALPPASFGDPLLDAKFILSAVDPNVGPAIAPALAPLANAGFFHVRADGQSIGYVATMMGSSVALHSIEQVQYALDQIASILEGRPAAGAMAS